jgi:hypothetical protein
MNSLGCCSDLSITYSEDLLSAFPWEQTLLFSLRSFRLLVWDSREYTKLINHKLVSNLMNYLIDTSSIYLNVRLKALGSVIPLWLISFVYSLLSHTSKRKDLREKSKVCSHGNAMKCCFLLVCVLYAQCEQFLWIVHLYYPFGIFWRLLNKLLYEEIADTKGAIKIHICRRRTDNTMTKRKSTKGQTTSYKTYS